METKCNSRDLRFSRRVFGDSEEVISDGEKNATRETPVPSNVVLGRGFGIGGLRLVSKDSLSDGWTTRTELDSEGKAGNLSPLRGSLGSALRLSSQNRNSSDVEFLEDDGQSSVCSESFYNTGDFSSLPVDISTKWSTWDGNLGTRRKKRESLVEALEKQRRESVANRLKELHVPNKRHSVALATSEMPIIAKSTPLKDAILPKQMRRSSYQSVLMTPPFFSKSSSSAKPLLGASLYGPEAMERRRGSLVSQRVETPTYSTWGSRYFPLRETESLSGVEHFIASPSSEIPRMMSMGSGSVESVDAPHSSAQHNQHITQSLKSNTELTRRTNRLNDINLHFDPALSAANSLELRSVVNESEEDGMKSVNGRERCADSDSDFPQKGTSRNSTNECLSDFFFATEASRLDSDSPSSSAVASDSPRLAIQDEASTTVKSRDNCLNGFHSTTASHSLEEQRSVPSMEKNSDSFSSVLRKIERLGSIQSCRNDDTVQSRIPAARNLVETTFNPTDTLSEINHTPDGKIIGKNSCVTNTEACQQESIDRGESDGTGKEKLRAKEMRKYYSDIRVQLKEPEQVIPSNSMLNEDGLNLQGDALPEEGSTPTDDDSDDAEPKVTPNWSSYPGKLIQGSSMSDLDTNDENSTSYVPKRSISKLEIYLQPAISSAMTTELPSDDKKAYVGTPEKKVTESSANSVVNPRRSSADRPRGREVFEFRRPNSLLDGDRALTSRLPGEESTEILINSSFKRQSVEHKEIFLIDSSPTTNKSFTLSHDPWAWSPKITPVGTNISNGVYTQKSDNQQKDLTALSAKSPAEYETSNSADFCFGMASPKMSTSRNALYSKQDDEKTKFRDDQTMPSRSEATGKFSDGSVNWQTPVSSRPDRWKDEKLSKDRGSWKTPNVDRIWESLEQSKPRSLNRRPLFRQESDSGERLILEKPQPQRNRISSDSGSREVTSNEMERMARSTSIQDVNQFTDLEAPVDCLLLEIDVPKGGLGLGFCIEGGKDGPYGDRPITVKRLFRGSSDSKLSCETTETLRAGDEILSANGRDMTLLSRFVAWNYLKTLPEGMIKLVIRRRIPTKPYSNHVQ